MDRRQTALNHVTANCETQHERIKELEGQLAKTIGVRDELSKANWKLAEDAKQNDEIINELQSKQQELDRLVPSIEETKGGRFVVSLYYVDAAMDRLMCCSPRSRKSANDILGKLSALTGEQPECEA